MNITDYVIGILLIAVIFLQVRTHSLSLLSIALPVVLLVIAGAIYLRPFALQGNDLNLIVVLAALGIVLGVLSGLGDAMWRAKSGNVLARAGVVSVVAWILGMGLRFGFVYYSSHSGTASVVSFSTQHQITGALAWTTAFVIMAFAQVLARVVVLQIRRIRTGELPLGPMPAPVRSV